jgi:hypothetical protein
VLAVAIHHAAGAVLTEPDDHVEPLLADAALPALDDGLGR